MEKNEWLALNFISFCRSVMNSFVGLFTPLFLFESGLAPAEVAGVVLAGAIARIATAPFLGSLNDMVGTRRMLQLSLAGMAAGAFGLSLAGAGKAAAIAAALPIALFYVSNNSLLQSIEASLYKKTTDEKIAGHAGEYIAVKQIAWGGAILLGGVLLLTNGFESIMAGIGIVALCVIPATFLVRHTAKIEFDLGGYAKQLSRAKVLALAACVFIVAYEWGTESTMLAPIYKAQMGLDSAQIGLVSFVANLAIAVVSYAAGKKFAGNAKAAGMVWNAMLVGMLLGAAGSFWLVAANTFNDALLARLVYNCGEALIQFSAAYLIGTIFVRTHVGGANGMMNFVAMIGMACASFMAGVLTGAGIAHPFAAVGVFMLIGAIVAWKSRSVLE